MSTVYIVEVESGSSESSGCMVFDSVWTSRELAEEYCQKFKRDPSVWHSEDWDFDITEYQLDTGN